MMEVHYVNLGDIMTCCICKKSLATINVTGLLLQGQMCPRCLSIWDKTPEAKEFDVLRTQYYAKARALLESVSKKVNDG